MANKLRVIMDVSQIVYQGTGVGRYTYELTKALLERDKHDYTFFVGALRRLLQVKQLSETSPFSNATWKFAPFPPRTVATLFHRLGVPIEWFVGTGDIFHSSDWSQPIAQMPRVTTVHDLAFRMHPETIDPVVLTAHQDRMARVAKGGVHIIADSQSTKKDLERWYEIPSEKIDVIYPGISDKYKPQKNNEIEQVKKKYKLPNQYILSVGTQEPRKNLMRLSEAADTLKIPLVLIGRQGWGEKTQTLGYVPDEDLPALYSASTVFAYPSLYEGFGFPVLEALRCGVPVVTSTVSSLPEVGGKAAVLVDPTDVQSIARGIAQAMKEKDKRIPLGLKHSRTFTWSATAGKVEDVYAKLATK